MKQNKKSHILIFLILLLLIGTSFTALSSSKNVSPIGKQGERTINGQILFSPLYGTTTYLIDNTGAINHTWSSSYTPGAATYWVGNNTIMRTIRAGFSSQGGAGGGVQKVTWSGTITWDFRYNTNGHLSHHDIKVLPNGNVLMIAWETKTAAQAVAVGRNPSTITGNSFMPDHIIEVQPTGQTSGDIIWEWHAWDHLIQNYDSSKANYGVVGDHPELIDINFGTFYFNTDDWMHTNSIDYNLQFDQILISVHNFDEIWVIDHSTTTEEAADHTGGNSGKGGDLLYRWGNPESYDAGTASDQKLFGQHDTQWIKPDYPGAGHILIFNNGLNRPGGQYSSVDEIAPPVNDDGEYYLESGSAYGPESLTWSYTASPPTSFYAYYISGAERLKDGNTLICDGVAARFFEVTSEKITVWQWTNPYPSPNLNDVFKIAYILPPEPPEPPQNNTPDLQCEGSMNWSNIQPEATVHGSFQIENVGNPNSTLNWTVDSYPDWGTWSFTPFSGENLTTQEGALTVQVYVTAPNQKNTEFQGYIRVINTDDPNDFDLIPIYLKTPTDDSLIQAQTLQFLSQYSFVFFEKRVDLLK